MGSIEKSLRLRKNSPVRIREQALSSYSWCSTQPQPWETDCFQSSGWGLQEEPPRLLQSKPPVSFQPKQRRFAHQLLLAVKLGLIQAALPAILKRWNVQTDGGGALPSITSALGPVSPKLKMWGWAGLLYLLPSTSLGFGAKLTPSSLGKRNPSRVVKAWHSTRKLVCYGTHWWKTDEQVTPAGSESCTLSPVFGLLSHPGHQLQTSCLIACFLYTYKQLHSLLPLCLQ